MSVSSRVPWIHAIPGTPKQRDRHKNGHVDDGCKLLVNVPEGRRSIAQSATRRVQGRRQIGGCVLMRQGRRQRFPLHARVVLLDLVVAILRALSSSSDFTAFLRSGTLKNRMIHATMCIMMLAKTMGCEQVRIIIMGSATALPNDRRDRMSLSDRVQLQNAKQLRPSRSTFRRHQIQRRRRKMLRTHRRPDRAIVAQPPGAGMTSRRRRGAYGRGRIDGAQSKITIK